MVLSHAAEPADGELVKTDLCIVGAGPAGITIAREFLNTDTRVCLLESGGREMERRAQRRSRGESVGYPIHRLDQSRVRAFGGTSRHWPPHEGLAVRPLDPIDFEARPGLSWSGWPFDRTYLEPWYASAQAICRAGPYDYDPAGWTEGAASPLRLVDDTVGTTVFVHGPAAFDGYHAEVSAAPNLTLFQHATVTELVPDAQAPDRVDRVRVRRDDGSAFFVKAEVFVLAAGGIENPRLLLLSRGADPAGLGNRHDVVGRYFAERLSGRSGYVVADRPELIDRAGFYEVRPARGTRIQGAFRVADSVQRERRLHNCAFFLLRRDAAITAEAVRSMATLVKAARRTPLLEGVPGHLRNIVTGARDLAGYAAGGLAARRGGGRRPEVLIVRVQGEQAPDPESRITLGERTDDSGLPVARVDWRIDEADLASIRASQELLDTALRATGIGHVENMLGDEQPPMLFEGNYHHLGATRMHPDPRRGVVNADLQIHGVRNVYVAGSSVFPTYGCSNPTLTIVALALRLADHLGKRLAA
jgi:choline dehydrogenase-like flavoprotein